MANELEIVQICNKYAVRNKGTSTYYDKVGLNTWSLDEYVIKYCLVRTLKKARKLAAKVFKPTFVITTVEVIEEYPSCCTCGK